jgi:hypothetical protein
MVPVDTGISALLIIGLFSYVFNIHVFSSRLWRFVVRLGIVYFVLQAIYESFPHHPILQQLSVLVSVETKPPSLTESVFSWIFFLPLFYALFLLSNGNFQKAAKPRDIKNLGMLVKKNTVRNILTFPLYCFDQIAGCFPKRTA